MVAATAARHADLGGDATDRRRISGARPDRLVAATGLSGRLRRRQRRWSLVARATARLGPPARARPDLPRRGRRCVGDHGGLRRPRYRGRARGGGGGRARPQRRRLGADPHPPPPVAARDVASAAGRSPIDSRAGLGAALREHPRPGSARGGARHRDPVRRTDRQGVLRRSSTHLRVVHSTSSGPPARSRFRRSSTGCCPGRRRC